MKTRFWQTRIPGRLTPLSLPCLVLVVLFPLVAAGQIPPVPDTVSLQTPSLYTDSSTVRQIFQYTETLDPAANGIRQAAIYKQAVTAGDAEVQALAALQLATIYLREGNYSLSFEWVSKADAADALLHPDSPAHHYVMKHLASFFDSFGAFHIASDYRRQSVNISLRRDVYPGSRLFSELSAFAFSLHRAGQADSARYYYQQAIRVATDLHKPYWEASALNNYGIALQSMGLLDSSLTIYRLAMKKYQNSGQHDPPFLNSIRDNIGQVSAQAGDYTTAYESFMENYHSVTGSVPRDNDRHLWSSIRAADALIHLGRPAEAEALLDSARLLSARVGENSARESYLPILRVKVACASALGNNSEALRLQTLISSYFDSLAVSANTGKINALEGMLREKTGNYQQEIRLERLASAESAARARYRLVLVLLVFIILAGIVLLFILRQRRRLTIANERAEKHNLEKANAELRLHNEQLEKERLSHALDLRKKDITDLALDLSLKRKIHAELVEQLREIKASRNPAKGIQDLIQALKGQVESELETRLTPGNIEQVNHEFFDKLKTMFPDLTPTEVDMCGLLRLRLGPKEIGALRNITAHSVRVSKYRLKKKLGLPRDQDPETFLQSL